MRPPWNALSDVVTNPEKVLDARYRLDEILGTGATATVYRAMDERRNVWRAVKLLHPTIAMHERMRDRFDQEARLLVGLRHRNIVRVHATGTCEQGRYIVMDLVAGGTLQERLDSEGKMEPRMATSTLQQSLQGLHHAHEQGVVHRDLQPANIMLETDSTPRLVDFGIAVNVSEEEESSRGGIGTRGFVAPEQRLRDLAVDHRVDIYGAGATFLAMLTGGLWSPVHELTLESPDLEGVPRPLAEVVLKATRYSPEERYQTAAEMGRALADAHSKLQAQRPQEEPTIIMGDEDDDWAVLEQRRDFSEMDGPEALTPKAPQAPSPDSSRGSRPDKRVGIVMLLVVVAVVVALVSFL